MTQNPIIAFFTWWNEAMANPDQLTEENFARFFTSDARIYVNNNLRASCPAEMVPHYAAIAARCEAVAMVLPVEHELASETLAFVHCFTRVTEKGVTRDDEAMACAELRAGKIARFLVAPMAA
ncbi:hypothetical protein HT136_20525 [Novosphingobium profundi]|uniref:hypothetical protein n=1 Tax=Novosphingobium profundi TaxID=1774954 RepID=UPI001BDAB3C1|nr:hypothetical protein [Novosphingobium profundi]MBT0670757.1 hypothetical protein [Novosphingobium profundi]